MYLVETFANSCNIAQPETLFYINYLHYLYTYTDKSLVIIVIVLVFFSISYEEVAQNLIVVCTVTVKEINSMGFGHITCFYTQTTQVIQVFICSSTVIVPNPPERTASTAAHVCFPFVANG